MSVYVDSLLACIPNQQWRWNKSCHLIADTLDELHAFAARLGLRRAWFQSDARLPHYDLNESRRAKAVVLGAVEIDRKQLVEIMRSERLLAIQPPLDLIPGGIAPVRPASLKCISLWNPWAVLLAASEKRIETRHWQTHHRCWFAIHAAKHREPDLVGLINSPYFCESLKTISSQTGWNTGEEETVFRLPFGAIVGVARLVDIVPSEMARLMISRKERAFGNYEDGRFGWKFDNAQLLKSPIPYRGQQNIWTLYGEVVSAINSQVGLAA